MTDRVEILFAFLILEREMLRVQIYNHHILSICAHITSQITSQLFRPPLVVMLVINTFITDRLIFNARVAFVFVNDAVG